MVEFSLFQNDGAALYRPVPVRKRSYLSTTEGISEEQLTEALKNFFKGRVRNYKRIALTLLQNLKTKNRKRNAQKSVFTYPQKEPQDPPGQPQPPWPASVV